MFRRLSPVALVLALTGCGSDVPEDKFPPYAYKVSPEAAARVFKDDAKANATPADGQLPQRLVDSTGSEVDLTAYRGKKNLVLTVVRGIPSAQGGAPCPYCIAQAMTYTGNYDKFRERDAEILILFPGSADKVSDFIQQSAGKPAFPFPLLLDKDLVVCDRLGIRGDLAKPSTYVIDKTGAVTYAYVGETLTDRPSLKAVLGQLDKLKPASTVAPVPPPPKPTAPATVRSPATRR
ncbi:MAG: peroxiredoxin family protein [Fimbriiglobus sp.]